MAKFRVHTFAVIRFVDTVEARTAVLAAKRAKEITANLDARSGWDAEARREFLVDRMKGGRVVGIVEFNEDLRPLKKSALGGGE